MCAVGRGWCLVGEEPGRRAAHMEFGLEIVTSGLRAVKGGGRCLHITLP